MKASRIARAAIVGLSAAIVLSGCSVLQAFTPNVSSDIFATQPEFAKASTKAFGSPTWLPADATIIRVDYRDDGSAAIITYTSKTHFAAGKCTAKAAVPKPPIQDSWWPVTGIPADGVDCGKGWSAFAIGDQVFAAMGTPEP